AAVRLDGPGGVAVAGATGYDAATRRVTFTPSAALAAGTAYTPTGGGAQDTAGNTMTPTSWSFTTASTPPSGCPCSIWPATATPGLLADSDTAAVEPGGKFRPDVAGRGPP